MKLRTCIMTEMHKRKLHISYHSAKLYLQKMHVALYRLASEVIHCQRHIVQSTDDEVIYLRLS